MTSSEQIQLENIADVDYEIFALLKQRYSPRIFRDKKISEQHLNQLFEASRWAASASNHQPWRFLYAEKDTETYEAILDCLSDDNKKWAGNAPLLMLTAYKEKTDKGMENFHALHDLGLCLGGMTVQAQYMGIALHHMAGVDWKKAQKVFNIPEGFHVTTAVAIGHYGGDLEDLPDNLKEQETAARKRMPQSEFAFNGVWGGE